MAAGGNNGGGSNNQNRGGGGSRGRTNISYPIRHPNATTNPLSTSRGRIGMDASHPIIEHTNRPNRLN